jgi:uncharacterized protein HemY
MRLGRFQDARKDFEKFAELVASDKPRRAKALLQLSRACVKMKDTAQVQRYLDEAMKIDQQKPVFTAEERAEIKQLIQVSNGKG